MWGVWGFTGGARGVEGPRAGRSCGGWCVGGGVYWRHKAGGGPQDRGSGVERGGQGSGVVTSRRVGLPGVEALTGTVPPEVPRLSGPPPSTLPRTRTHRPGVLRLSVGLPSPAVTLHPTPTKGDRRPGRPSHSRRRRGSSGVGKEDSESNESTVYPGKEQEGWGALKVLCGFPLFPTPVGSHVRVDTPPVRPWG